MQSEIFNEKPDEMTGEDFLSMFGREEPGEAAVAGAEDADPLSLVGELAAENPEIEEIMASANPVRQAAETMRRMAPAAPTAASSTTAAADSAEPKPALKARAMAAMYVKTVDIGLDRVGRYISGKEDGREYRLSSTDRADYLEVSEAFFEAANVRLTPEIIFGLVTLFLVGGNVAAAYRHRREVKKAAEASAAAAKISEPTNATEVAAKAAFAPPVRKVVKRTKFATSASGFYMYSEDGDYLKKDQQSELPSPQVKAYIESYRNEHGGKPKDSQIRAYLESIAE